MWGHQSQSKNLDFICPSWSHISFNLSNPVKVLASFTWTCPTDNVPLWSTSSHPVTLPIKFCPKFLSKRRQKWRASNISWSSSLGSRCPDIGKIGTLYTKIFFWKLNRGVLIFWKLKEIILKLNKLVFIFWKLKKAPRYTYYLVKRGTYSFIRLKRGTHSYCSVKKRYPYLLLG